MIRFIKYKILNKKWLNFCLLTGVILLSAFLSVYPMFKEGSLNRLLSNLFTEYFEKYGTFPAVMSTKGALYGENYTDVDTTLGFLNSLETKWNYYTFAQVPPEVKNAHSHRGRAVQAMLALMRERWFA